VVLEEGLGHVYNISRRNEILGNSKKSSNIETKLGLFLDVSGGVA
jgi:hypothetical protein